MTGGGYKRVVVIKDIQSNFVEEAILILKSGNGSNEDVFSAVKYENRDNKYLLREAENIINNFIKQNEIIVPKKNVNKNILKKSKNNTKINIFINTGIIVCLILLAFLITKLF